MIKGIEPVPETKSTEIKSRQDSTLQTSPFFDAFKKTESMEDIAESSQDFTVRVSNGQKYNIKELIEEQLYLLSNNIYAYRCQKQKNICDKVKTVFGANPDKKIFDESEKLYGFIINTKDAKELFETVTGEKYNLENIEMLLKGELKIRLIKEFEELANVKIDIAQIKSLPVLSDWEVVNKLTQDKYESEDEEKYDFILSSLDNEYAEKFQKAKENGTLLLKSDFNKTTILDNLYKILTEQRAECINDITILKECIDILNNPCIISQNGESIPKEYANEVAKIRVNEDRENIKRRYIAYNNSHNKKIKINPSDDMLKEFIKEESYFCPSTCAAATIEYEIASKQPAEFFRMVEGLTSEKKEVLQSIENVDESYINFFKTPVKSVEGKNYAILRADKDAYYLAKIKNCKQEENERSVTDVIMQSMIMNLGSKGTYHSISDTRATNDWTSENSGLVSFEILYAQNVLTGHGTESHDYMQVNENGIIIERMNGNVKEEITEALNKNENIVVGLVDCNEETNEVFGGHEVTIIGKTKNLNGDNFFVAQDSNDEFSHPRCISEEELIKKIHHANYAGNKKLAQVQLPDNIAGIPENPIYIQSVPPVMPLFYDIQPYYKPNYNNSAVNTYPAGPVMNTSSPFPAQLILTAPPKSSTSQESSK